VLLRSTYLGASCVVGVGSEIYSAGMELPMDKGFDDKNKLSCRLHGDSMLSQICRSSIVNRLALDVDFCRDCHAWTC
jgi:hypothetical protein